MFTGVKREWSSSLLIIEIQFLGAGEVVEKLRGFAGVAVILALIPSTQITDPNHQRLKFYRNQRLLLTSCFSHTDGAQTYTKAKRSHTKVNKHKLKKLDFFMK